MRAAKPNLKKGNKTINEAPSSLSDHLVDYSKILTLQPDKFLAIAPAVVILARYGAASIGTVVLLFRLHQLGGDSACKKLVHRLERMGLLVISSSGCTDKRQKKCRLTTNGLAVIYQLKSLLDSLPLDSVKDGRDRSVDSSMIGPVTTVGLDQ